MKKLQENKAYTLYVGNAQSAKAMYKAIERACYKNRTLLWPLYADSVMVNTNKMYGILIDHEDDHFIIVSADTVLSLMLEMGVK